MVGIYLINVNTKKHLTSHDTKVIIFKIRKIIIVVHNYNLFYRVHFILSVTVKSNIFFLHQNMKTTIKKTEKQPYLIFVYSRKRN